MSGAAPREAFRPTADLNPELLKDPEFRKAYAEFSSTVANALQRELWSNMYRVYLVQTKFALKSQLAELVFRLSVLSVGTFFAYLGYRLFFAGFVGPANLEAKGGSYSVTLSQAAPGIFFALFGTIMIVFGISRLLPVPEAKQPELSLSAGSPGADPASEQMPEG